MESEPYFVTFFQNFAKKKFISKYTQNFFETVSMKNCIFYILDENLSKAYGNLRQATLQKEMFNGQNMF